MGECIERLTFVVLQVGIEDRWVWNLHPFSCCMINNAYKNLFEIGDNIIKLTPKFCG